MRIGLTSIFVDDQDQAEQFSTEVLGLQVKTSAAYGPTERWLTVVSPEEPDGVQLVLHLADEPARAFQQASREQGRPVLSLRTDDCAAEAARLKAEGVVFVKEPGRWPTGAWMRSSTTPAATCSTSTRTGPGTTAMPQLASGSQLELTPQGELGAGLPRMGDRCGRGSAASLTAAVH